MDDSIDRASKARAHAIANRLGKTVGYLIGTALAYGAVDLTCRFISGKGVGEMEPMDGLGGLGTYTAMFVANIAVSEALEAIGRLRSRGDPSKRRLIDNQASAELQGGVWLVTGVEDGMVTVMDPEEFRRFEARIAKEGAILTKVVPGTDGTVTTMVYNSGKLHRVGAPAVVRTKDGEVLGELWFEYGKPVEAPSVGMRP